MADQVDVSGGAPGTASQPAAGEEPRQFGLPAAMALIVGSIIGVGIFNLPTSLAFYGPITLVSVALTTVGALALALLFAALSRRLPADGGPYAYARAAFGNRLGFANAGSYWITAWGATRRSRWAGSFTWSTSSTRTTPSGCRCCSYWWGCGSRW
jgi:APA family basic amino acid/polyamine antiporter